MKKAIDLEAGLTYPGFMMTNTATATATVKSTIVADIPASTLGALRDKIARLNNRAQRLGLDWISIKELRRFARKTDTRKIPMVTVEIEGNAPRLAGWRIAAIVEHGSEGNIVRALDGQDHPDLREIAPTCDHCGVSRARKETYQLTNTDGRAARVGSSCLQDFVGNDVEAALFAATALADLASDLDEDGLFGGGGSWDADLEEFLAYVAMSVRESGWCSRSKARDHGYGEATADIAWAALMAPPRPNVKRATPTDADAARAARALETVRETLEAAAAANTLNDYQHNLRVVLAMDSIESKHAGLAASVLPFYDREIEQRQRREARASLTKDSAHVGAIKERLQFGECQVLGVRYIDGDWGVTTLITFVTSDGNVIKWFASKEVFVKDPETGNEREIEPGDCVKVKGTVKKHGEYKGVKETQVNRCIIS